MAQTQPTQTQLAGIAGDLDLSPSQVAGAAALFEDGADVPFIARYRKERTGGLDEEQLRSVRDRMQEVAEIDARRRKMIDSLAERGLADEELLARLTAARTKAALEDIYLPYRPKRRTRASTAKDRGLEALASWLLAAGETGRSDTELQNEAQKYVDVDGNVPDAEAALAGARDILAEWISEDPALRGELRELFGSAAVLSAKRAPKRRKETDGTAADGARDDAARDDAAQVYRDYFDHREPARRAPSHRVLAMFRGEREGLLTVHVLPPEDRALAMVRRGRTGAAAGAVRKELETAAEDAYKRLLAPSLENEAKARLKTQADETAATVFAQNLRELLLSPPLGERAVLAVDPGFRTGCKVVCLDRHGELLHHETIYPLEPRNRRAEAAQRVQALISRYTIEVIAVGNGTGGREAAAFLREVGGDAGGVSVISVNEAGASVYSASPAARAEFPEQDVTVRGAVSIGRRLMDPLAELVKIDPKSIGVGQYQHDVDQKLLDAKLRDTVVSCVNAVGVDLNTASPHLLQYVSGISPRLAQAIVDYRGTRGGFSSRGELQSVPGLGDKTFEQAAGFLRVRGQSVGEGTTADGKRPAQGEERASAGGKDPGPRRTAHPLDVSGIHPERYPLVEAMARDLGVGVRELVGNEALVVGIDLQKYVDEATGAETLQDILAELREPGRDPRPPFEEFAFSEDVHDIADLREGMQLPGVVTNVTNFGAFVDIGVHRDGLIHISKLADRFVSDPREVVRVNQTLNVTVLEVDTERKRIGLSLVD